MANNKPLITCDADFETFKENGLKVVLLPEEK